MKNWLERLKSPYMVIGLIAVKLITYYVLIGVNIFSNLSFLASMVVFVTLFASLGSSGLKRRQGWFFISYTFFSIIMFADTMYYNYYNQTVSIKQLWQVSNVAKVPSSFVATLIPASFLLIVDIPFVCYYFKRNIRLRTEQPERKRHTGKIARLSLGVSILVILLAVNPFGSTMVEKLNSVEFFTNHVGDIYRATISERSMKMVSAEEVLETVQRNVDGTGDSNLKGIAKGKNLIVLQVEALQNFVIGASYNGQELTPNLNKLMRQDTLYYENYYSVIGKGNTADAEFTTLNSLYPVIDAECYRLYQDNTYNGLPWLLKDQGYETFGIHGYEGDFWNRNAAYPYQGFEEFYSMEDLEQDEIIGLGISDKSMFRQAVSIMEKKKQPFFSFIVTLTNHHPYILDEDKKEISLLPEHEDTKFGSYLETVRYTDQAIGEFIEQLKAAGLYENTVIALYGDHHGLNCKMDHNDVYMSEFLGRAYDYDEMLKVPMMIHIPGSGVTRTVSTLGGQIDFLPTVANLMSLDIVQPYVLGQDLTNAKEGFVAFTAYLFEGSFAKDDVMMEISREGIFNGSRAFQIGTGRELDASLYEEEYNKAVTLKEASKNILEQDLIGDYVTREAAPYVPENDRNTAETGRK